MQLGDQSPLEVPKDMLRMGVAWCNQETQSPLEVPKNMLRMGVAWCDRRFEILGATRQTAGSITAQEEGGARGKL